jgi:hypothetical protein
MNEMVFVPRHKWIILTILALPLLALGVGALWWGALWSDWSYLLLGASIVLVLPLAFVCQPKEIRFKEAEIVIRRPPFNNLVLPYEKFSGIDNEMIWFGNKMISLTFLENSQELSNIFAKLMNDRKISYPPLPAFDLWLMFKAFRISWFVPFIFANIFSIITSDLLDLELMHILLINLTLFVGLFSVCYLSIRRREKRKRNAL